MKMKTIIIKGQEYKVAADATIAAPGFAYGVYFRSGNNWHFTDGKHNNFMLLGELPRGPLGAKLYESVYVGDAPKRKLTNVEIFSLAKLVLSLSLLVSVIAVIAIDVIGAQP
jgi:hypothetical protein